MPSRLLENRFFAVLLGGVILISLAFFLIRGPGGIGGTGIDGGDGLGGTGIVGVIEKFGSIYVNGLKIEYADTLAIDINGTVGGPADLRLGQVVEVLADDRSGGVFQARSIAIRYEVVGPATLIDPSLGRLDIMGQKVQITTATLTGTMLNDLQSGTIFAVSGYRTSDGVIAATRLEPVPVSHSLSIRGTITAGEPGRLSIGGLPIDLTSNPDVRAGDVILATGSLRSGNFIPDSIRPLPAEPFDGKAERLVIQDYQIPVPLEVIRPDEPVPDRAPVEPEPVPDATPQRQEIRNIPQAGTAPKRPRIRPEPRQVNRIDRTRTRVPIEVMRAPVSDGDVLRPAERPGIVNEVRTMETTIVPVEIGPEVIDTPEAPGSDMLRTEGTRPERVKPDVLDRPKKLDRPRKIARPKKIERPEKIDRPKRPERPKRPDRI